MEKFETGLLTGRGETASLLELLGIILARNRIAKLFLFIFIDLFVLRLIYTVKNESS